jgi:hypothetical protein
LESCTRDRYDGRSMTLYHPIKWLNLIYEILSLNLSL